MSPEAVNLYLNFSLNAILGRLSDADALMHRFGVEINHVARAFAQRFPTTATLYRGMLLDPSVPYAADPVYTFQSWSEDRDVALWFACPQSVISVEVAQVKPHLRGYLAEIPVARASLLFHHTWVAQLGGVDAFVALARQHPHMGHEGARQIEWSLTTQREVITMPVAGLHPQPVEDLPEQTRTALDQRLAPAWML